ncbi:ABC transporter substrate-binding protein [Vineibacter terrae]|uniref:ABC transporter substrate-binding protein n=1 Tax=Vineibacter terrae TaxID=2586908 RepID=UPI002E353C2F|nr:ABC transporter substrate-binding protein [Vineibacter terrae]HEX2890334.1 ABC transporter substrate-binding protein [Vineibacter terrae]
MSLRSITRRASVATVAALLAMPAHAQTSGEPIKIGAVVSITGAGAGLGGPERNGMLLAEKAINAKGGIQGRPLKLIIEDDASNPDTALSKANDLLFSQKVVALLGPSLTASTVAIGGITHANKVPQIAFTGIGPAVEKERKCLAHVLPPQRLNAEALLEHAKSIKATKIGVLHDAGYGNVVMAELKQLVDKYGVKLVAVEKFEIGATDTTTQAAKVKASQPDAVFIIATSATPFRNVKQVQITQPIVAAIGSSSYEYVSAMGSAADNITIPEFVVGEDPLPHQKAFVDLYKQTYSSVPKNYEAAGWDAVHAIAQALTKAGANATGEALCAAMRAPYAGVLANYDFSAADMTGIALSSYVYSKLVAGKYTRTPFRVSP